jgi:hypothetical protein
MSFHQMGCGERIRSWWSHFVQEWVQTRNREYSVAVQTVPDHKVLELGVVIAIGMVVRNRPVVRFSGHHKVWNRSRWISWFRVHGGLARRMHLYWWGLAFEHNSRDVVDPTGCHNDIWKLGWVQDWDDLES